MKPNSKLGPWDLYLEGIDETVQRSLAVTEYPYRVGADVEDLGPKAERYSFRAVIKGADFDKNYLAIRDWFRQTFTSAVELLHPDLGVVVGYPENATFARNDRKRYASFSFDFVIAGLDPEIASRPDLKASAIAKIRSLNMEAQTLVANALVVTGIPDVAGSDWSLLDKWSDMGALARKASVGLGIAAGKLGAVISQVQAPADAISTSIDYIGSLSGSLVSQVQKCAEAYVSVYRALNVSRVVLLAIADDCRKMLSVDLKDSPEIVRSTFATLCSATLCYESARYMAEDEVNLSESIAGESARTDDADGRVSGPTTGVYLLTPAMLEDSLAIVRQFIQDHLGIMASSSTIEAMAAELAEAVRQFKLRYLSTRKIIVSSPRPLHTILNDAGLSYKAGERVCALNGFKNPTFCSGEVLVYES